MVLELREQVVLGYLHLGLRLWKSLVILEYIDIHFLALRNVAPSRSIIVVDLDLHLRLLSLGHGEHGVTVDLLTLEQALLLILHRVHCTLLAAALLVSHLLDTKMLILVKSNAIDVL